VRFSTWFVENASYYDTTYYVAWTPYQDDAVVAISVVDTDEAVSLATKNTPLNVQVVTENAMTYNEMQNFLDKLADLEGPGRKFRLLYGNGVDQKRISLL